MVPRASSILPSQRLSLGQTRETDTVMRTLLPARQPAKPWRISETPSPAAAELRPRPAEHVATDPDERKAVLFSDG